MRILTWNCQGGCAKKLHAIAALQPDLAIIQECESPHRLRAAGMTAPIVWHSDTAKKGLAVISFANADLQIDAAHDPSIKHLLPVRVGGKRPVHLLAVWTKVTDNPHHGYVGQACIGIETYAPFLSDNEAVVVGDFNSNPIFDRPNGQYTHTRMVALLAHHGLASAYHHHFSEPQGQETRGTFFMWRRQERGFHIDYCFLPRAWLPHLRSVFVGKYQDWHTLSDHSPIVVDLDFTRKQSVFARLYRHLLYPLRMIQAIRAHRPS